MPRCWTTQRFLCTPCPHSKSGVRVDTITVFSVELNALKKQIDALREDMYEVLEVLDDRVELEEKIAALEEELRLCDEGR